MTDNNAAVAETNAETNAANSNGEKWDNRFGVLKGVTKARTRNQKDVVTGVIIGKNNTEFPFQTYSPKMIEHILAKGDGQEVDLRGPVKPWEFVRRTEAGGTYKERGTMFTAMMVNTKRTGAKKAETAAEESVSEETGASVDAQADAGNSIDDQIPF